MTDITENVNTYTQSLFEGLASSGIQKAADGLTTMVGKECRVSHPEVRYVDVLDLPKYLGSLEEEVVGVYLRVWTDLPVQFILLLPHQQALGLADMLMGQPPGTTMALDRVEQSALAEVGNLTSSMFLNAIANVTDLPLRPSTPGVMIDMVSAIMNVIVASMDDISQQVLLFQTAFEFPEQQCKLDFWAIPNMETVQSILNVIDHHDI